MKRIVSLVALCLLALSLLAADPKGETFGPNKNKRLVMNKSVDKITVKPGEAVSIDFRFESGLPNAVILYDESFERMAIRGNKAFGKERLTVAGGKSGRHFYITGWHRTNNEKTAKWKQSMKAKTINTPRSHRVGYEDAVDKDFNDAVAIVRPHGFGPDKKQPLRFDTICEKLTPKAGETAHVQFYFKPSATYQNTIIIYDQDHKQVALRDDRKAGSKPVDLPGGMTYYITAWHRPMASQPWQQSVKRKTVREKGVLVVGYEDSVDNDYRDAMAKVTMKK